MRVERIKFGPSKRRFREPDIRQHEQPRQNRASFGSPDDYVEVADEWLGSDASAEWRETWTGPPTDTKPGWMRALIKRAMTRLRRQKRT